MYNYLYIAIITIIIIFIFSFIIQYAWIPILLFLLYWIYKNIKIKLSGGSRQADEYTRQDYYQKDDYDSYTNQSSSRSNSVIEADYKVVDEEETKQHQ